MQWQLINAGPGRAGKVKASEGTHAVITTKQSKNDYTSRKYGNLASIASTVTQNHSIETWLTRQYEKPITVWGGTGVGTVKYLSLPSSLALHYPGTSVIVCNYISLLMRSMNRYIKGYLELKCWYNISRKYLYNCIVTEPSGISGSTATEAQQVLQPRLNVFHIGFPRPEVVEL